MGKKLSLTLIILGTVFLILGQVALWARWQVLSPQRFSHHAAKIFQEEPVRLALAQALVRQALKDRPILLKATEKPASAAIGGLLGTPTFTESFEKTSALLFKALTQDYSEGIKINLEPAHQYLAVMIPLAKRGLDREIIVEDWPTEIVILEPGQLPPLHKIPVGLSWIAALGFVLAGACYFWVLRKDLNRRQNLKWLGMTLIAVSALLMLSLFPVRSFITQAIPQELGVIVVGAFYDAFVHGLMLQSGFFLLIGLGLYWANRSPAQQP